MKKQMLRLVLFFIAVLGLVCYPEKKAYAAATKIQVVAVAYSDESIIVKNNGNTRIYFATEADAGRGYWDSIDVKTTETFTVIDFSYLSPNTENIMKIKGAQEQTPSRVIIRKRPQRLDVSINYSNFDTSAKIAELLNIRSTEGSGLYPITIKDLEWKKGTDGEWLASEYLETALLKRYLLKGTILYFRTAALDDVADVSGVVGYDKAKFSSDVSGYSYKNKLENLGATSESSLVFSDATLPDGMDGRRPGSEVRLKINKQDATPITNIDGGEFTMGIRYGQEYRISLDNGVTYTNWFKVTDTMSKPLKLATMLYNATNGADTSNGLTDAFPQMSIDVRDFSTARAASSKIVTTNIPIQRVIAAAAVEGTPTVADNNVYVSYNGNKNVIVTIPSATDDYPYEYTVVRSGATLDVDRATWTEINKNTPVKIASTKAVDGSTLYFRKKEIKYQAETNTHVQVNFQLASTYATFNVTYPSLPVAPKKTYVYTKGYSGDIEIVVQLNIANRKPFENHVKAVKLGTKDIPFTQNPDIVQTPGHIFSPAVVNYLTIKLTGTELAKMANCTARTIAIYYDNGTVDKATSKLTIKNPTDAGALLMNVNTSVPNTVTVSVASTIPTTSKLVYNYSTDVISGKKCEDTVDASYKDLDATGIIDTTGRSGQYLTVYEVTKPVVPTDPSYIVRYNSVKLP